MGLNFRSPWIILLGIILLALVLVPAFLLRKRRRGRTVLRVANTQRLKSIPVYKKKIRQALILRILSIAGIVISLLAATLLTARPYRRDTVKDDISRRDIFLCIDLSSSSFAGVRDLVQEFDRTVDGLDGDRIGISLFNTSSSRFVPMTDDYDFVHQRLASLEEYLAAEEEFMINYAGRYNSIYDIPESERSRYDELNRIMSSFDDGVTAGYAVKGTSAVGEGLASCLFSFPELTSQERTRIIIFLTDNKEELLEDPLVTLEESAQMCEKDKVVVFGIYPGGNTSDGNTGSSSAMAAPAASGAFDASATISGAFDASGTPAASGAFAAGTSESGSARFLAVASDGSETQEDSDDNTSDDNGSSSDGYGSSSSGNGSSSGGNGSSSDGNGSSSDGNGSPSDGSDADAVNRMKSAVELTGGTFYESGSSLTAKEILADIASREIRNSRTVTATLDQDTPFFWTIILILGFLLIAGTTLYFVLLRGIRKGKTSRKVTAAVLLLVMGIGIVIIGIRPMYRSPSVELMTRNLDVAFVVDTTISMWAEDHGSGTRIEGVKQDIHSIMDALPGSSFSLIRFDNGAEIMTPFTQDIDALNDIIDNLNMPAYATAQGSSLNTAYEALQAMVQAAEKKEGSRKTIVFVFSDGETTDGSTLMDFSGLSGLIDEGAVMGYGTEYGGEMQYPGKGYIINNTTGEHALSKLDESSLRQIADDLRLDYINETSILGEEGNINLSLDSRLRSIRLMSRNAAFKDGDRTGYKDTYFYFSGAVGILLLVWLFLTVHRGSVA